MPPEYDVTSVFWDASQKAFAERKTAIELKANDVLIKVSHSGLCTTDVHALDSGCSLGHEGVGVIEQIGEVVTSMRIGQRVGWGLDGYIPYVFTDPEKSHGYRQYCAQARGFAFSDTDQGALSDYRIINCEFAYLIPDSISSLHAGPLMCAGASTYEALYAAGTKPTDRVGVFGIGGLGHMAILFAKAMGCGVTAFSKGTEKVTGAFEMGADEFRDSDALGEVCTRNGSTGEMERSGSPQAANIDVLLITSNAVPDLEKLLPLLARRATIVLMTIQGGSLSIPYMPFILPGHRIIASTEASRQNHLDMLSCVARHNIKPWVEEFTMDLTGVAQAFERLQGGKMRYRGVLTRRDSGP